MIEEPHPDPSDGSRVAETAWSKPGFEDFDLAPRLDMLDKYSTPGALQVLELQALLRWHTRLLSSWIEVRCDGLSV